MVAALEKIRKRVSCIDCQLEAILALMIGIDCLYLHIVTFSCKDGRRETNEENNESLFPFIIDNLRGQRVENI